MFDSLAQDIRYALRGIRAHPGFATTVSLTIALGIGANATMFGVVDRLLFRGPAGVRDPERVVQLAVHWNGESYSGSSFSYPGFTDIRDQPGAFSSVAMTYSTTFPLDRGANASSAAGALVSGNYFQTLGVRPLVGRFFAPDDDDPRRPHMVAVVSYGFWQRQLGGRPNVLGSTLTIGTSEYRVIGVTPKGFSGIDLKDVAIWLPVTAPSGLRFDNSPEWLTNRHATWLNVVARIQDGVNPRLAAEQATAAYRAGRYRQKASEPAKNARWITPDSESIVLASLVPGKVPTGVGGSVSESNVKVSRLLGIVSLIVLLIACANVANLLLVRAFRRRREIAIRLALGVSRARLLRQLIVEGVVLSLIGGGGALLVAHWTSQSVRTLLLGSGAWTGEPVDARLLVFTALATIGTGVITSLAPALQAMRSDLHDALKAGAREGGGQHSPLRTTLLVVQATLAIVLLTGAGVFIRSVANINQQPFGVDLDHVLVADIKHRSVGLTNAEAQRLYYEAVDRVSHMPGVQSAAVSVGLPFALSWGADLHLPGGRKPPETRGGTVQYAVTPGYFATMGVRLVAGRLFTAQDRGGTAAVAVINETMARLYWPNQDPVGQCVRFESDATPCTTVVGVATNTVRQNLSEGFVSQIYRPLDQLAADETDHTVSFFGYSMVVRTTRDAGALAEPVRRSIQSVSSVIPYATVRPMRDLLLTRMRSWNMGAKVFTALGVLSLVLATIGLYSVLAFSIAQRLREFGVRMALGARGVDLVRLTVSIGLAPIIGGIACGLFLALLLGKFVATLLFHVSPRDPTILAGVCAIVLVTASLASLIPALRATRVDPATVLRAE